MIKQLSESIGHDGAYYTCLRCGKSGYEKMAQVKGHLAMCPGTQMRKGVPAPGSMANQPQLAGHLAAASWEPAIEPNLPSPSYQQQQQQLEPAPASYVQLASPSYSEYNQLKAEVRQMQNHWTHMMEDKNPVSGKDWFSQNRQAIIMVGVGVIIVVYLMASKNKSCPVDCSTSGSSGSGNVQGIAQKTMTKVLDRAVIKGVDALFKAA